MLEDVKVPVRLKLSAFYAVIVGLTMAGSWAFYLFFSAVEIGLSSLIVCMRGVDPGFSDTRALAETKQSSLDAHVYLLPECFACNHREFALRAGFRSSVVPANRRRRGPSLAMKSHAISTAPAANTTSPGIRIHCQKPVVS